MPTVWTNETKTSEPLWDDTIAAWDDQQSTWDALSTVWVNEPKN